MIDKFLQEDLDALLNNPCIEWSNFFGKNFFITGATGLIGSFIVRALQTANKKINANINIICFVRSQDKALRLFETDSNLSFICGDIRSEIIVNENVDYIIHCASITSSRLMVDKPVDTLLTAIEGTRNILNLAKKKSVESMVYVSSMEVYGAIESEQRISEDILGYIDNLKVRSTYPEGKRVCETMCAAYAKEYGVSVKIARLAQTFGTGVSYEENRVFAQFAKSVVNGNNIVLHTEGKSYGNYCYTMDTVSALLCILLRGKNSEAYNVVNEQTTMSIKDMAEMVTRELGRGVRVEYDIPESSLQYGYAQDTKLKMSSEKLKQLGWEPTYNLLSMYKRMIGSWGWNEDIM